MTGVVRFQDSPWYVRLWRRRWLLLVPWWTLKQRLSPGHWEFIDREWANAWGLSCGIAHGRMGWWFTAEEVWGDDWRTADYGADDDHEPIYVDTLHADGTITTERVK